MDDIRTKAPNEPLQGGSAISRRNVIAGSAALAAFTLAAPARAERTLAGGGRPVVLITGTSSGFGRLMAETFSRNGMHVIATMRESRHRNAPAAAELRRLAATENLPIDVVDIDVTDQKSVDHGTAEALRCAGRVDVLVNNAGIVIPGPLEVVPLDAVNRCFDTNVYGGLRVFKALAPQMREQQSGYLIQVSSGLGRIPIPGTAAYNASKAALESVSDNLAMEETGFGIDVTVVQPSAPYPTRLQINAQRYLTEALAALPHKERHLVATFEPQIQAVRQRLVGDPRFNPQEVASGVLALILMPPGTRPRRQIIGPAQENLAMVNAAHDRAMAAHEASRALPTAP